MADCKNIETVEFFFSVAQQIFGSADSNRIDLVRVTGSSVGGLGPVRNNLPQKNLCQRVEGDDLE